MDENTVVTNDAVEIETPQADAGAVDEQPIETVEEAPIEAPQQADAAERLFTKKEVDEMIRRKAGLIEHGITSKPMYQAVKALSEQLGGDPNAAAQKLLEDQINRRAKELAENPEEFAKAFLQRQIPQAPPQEDETQQKARRIAQELAQLNNDGQLPSGFNLDNYVKADPDFLRNAEEFGAKAAIKIASLTANPNKNLPQSTRPASNAQPAPADYTKMSTAEFWENEKKIEQKARGW